MQVILFCIKWPDLLHHEVRPLDAQVQFMKKLYIKTNSLKKHLSLICELALFLDLKYFAVWFYPEAKRKKLSLPFESNFYKEDMLEPITDYDEDQELERVRLYRSFNKRKCTFLQDFKTIEKFVDSICFYKRKKQNGIYAA